MTSHEYRRISSTSHVCRLCGHDMCKESAKPCEPLDMDELRDALIEQHKRAENQRIAREWLLAQVRSQGFWEAEHG